MAKKRKSHKCRKIYQCRCFRCREHPYGGATKQHRAINRVLLTLNEKHRRRFVGLLALQRGRGGVQDLALITGLSRNTIRRGREEVRRADHLAGVRQAGAGRKAVEKNSPAF
jgi:hypothetical protein